MQIDTQLGPRMREAVHDTWRRWHKHGVVGRVWEADPRVWSAAPLPELADRLGWLDLHESQLPTAPGLSELARRVAGEASDVVVLGMGGSSLAPEVFGSILGGDGPRLRVLDSTHPEVVTGLHEDLDLTSTVFIVSSKSGTTLETLSFFRYFWDATKGAGSQFVAVTDPGTPLERLARERGFAAAVTAPPDVGGRYSALTPFGLLPAAFAGIDPIALLQAAGSLAHRARSHPAESALDLGAVWGTGAMLGRDKLTLLTSPSLAALPAWLEQLVAESLGKEGTGIVPVAGEPLRRAGTYGADRIFLVYEVEGEQAAPDGFVQGIVDAGHPLTRIRLEDRYDLGAEMLRAELATAAAGEIIGIHPFDQPDVEAAKRHAREAMDGAGSAPPVPAMGIRDSGAGSTITELIDEVGERGYLALQVYLPPTADLDAALEELRQTLGRGGGPATTSGYGPRFLHSTGQLHKGGPGAAAFIQIVDQPRRDLTVPETDYDFGSIIEAQAAGDVRALVDAGRRVVRLRVGEDPPGEIRALAASIQ